MTTAENILEQANRFRNEIGDDLHDKLTEAVYTDATAIADRVVSVKNQTSNFHFDQTLDRILTSRIFGFPLMILMLTIVLWLTIAGANVPSALLGEFLQGTIYDFLHSAANYLNAPWWLSGFLIDGVYLATAWVVSVMLPPMAIFFPLFTLLEDLGYLPRVAFNLDRLFKRAGAHGKQSLSMMMGYGCNAAGVVSTRIIDSPRERLIAIITNNFRFATEDSDDDFSRHDLYRSDAPPALASFIAATSVAAVAILGIVFTLLVSAILSKTLLKGEASSFTLELPPYRPPQIWQTLYRSIIDRTLIVLKRAVWMAAPAGAVIWLISNIIIGSESIAAHLINLLNPFGLLIGLNGVILLAYIVAIPANEIVVPTILMLTLNLAKSNLAQNGVMSGIEDDAQIREILTGIGGWTLLTGINLMLFSLLHNPCSTTILTIWKETKSLKWTAISTFLPIMLGIIVCLLTATAARLIGFI